MKGGGRVCRKGESGLASGWRADRIRVPGAPGLPGAQGPGPVLAGKRSRKEELSALPMHTKSSVVSLVLTLVALSFAAGCRTVPRAEAPAAEEPVAAAEERPSEEELPEPREPDVPVELAGVALSLEEMADFLAIRDYRFRGLNGGVEVSLTLENLTAEEHLSLLVATSFLGRGDEELFRTEWVEVELAPRRRHYYSAQTGDRSARSAQVLLRAVEWPEE